MILGRWPQQKFVVLLQKILKYSVSTSNHDRSMGAIIAWLKSLYNPIHLVLSLGGYINLKNVVSDT